MAPYLAIVSGLIKFANWAAQALQQHHDETNGANKVIGEENAANAKAQSAAAQAMVDTTRDSAVDQLRRGDA